MKFTPFSIKNQEFNRSVRGYDKDEVRAYLEKLSDEVENIQQENARFKSQIDKMRSEMDEYKKIEKNLQSTLLSAQESSSRAVESAKKQTALLIKESEIKAAQIIEEARENADSIRDSVLKLREEKKLLLSKLKALVETQAGLIDISFKETYKPEPQREEKTAELNDNSNINVDDILEKLL